MDGSFLSSADRQAPSRPSTGSTPSSRPASARRHVLQQDGGSVGFRQGAITYAAAQAGMDQGDELASGTAATFRASAEDEGYDARTSCATMYVLRVRYD